MILLERTEFSLHQKIDLLMLNTTNSLIEPQEVVKPCYESCEVCWPTTNNPPPNITHHGLRDLKL